MTKLFGRLRAAMIRATHKPDPNVLKALLQEKKSLALGRQTVHNWFKPTCQFIEPQFLFAIADLLDVSAEWLATGQGLIDRPRQLDDDMTQLIGLYKSFPDEESRAKWFRDAVKDGNELLALLKKHSAATPFPGAK